MRVQPQILSHICLFCLFVSLRFRHKITPRDSMPQKARNIRLTIANYPLICMKENRRRIPLKVLVTGFDPFGGEQVNPAYEAVKRLPDEIDGGTIIKLELPTAFDASCIQLKEAIELHRPDVVLCVGQAGGRAKLAVERVAVNLRDARIPDNAGVQPVDEPVRPGGANAYFSNLPVKAIVSGLEAQGIPAYVSYTAGTYVCNSLMYTLLDWIERAYPQMRGGFIHVPYSMEQAAGKPSETPSMDLAQMTRGLALAIHIILSQA